MGSSWTHASVCNKCLWEPTGSTVGSQYQHGAEDADVVSDELHLVPELHLASVVPVAQVAVDEQDHQRQDGGQDLRGQADVAAREEGQGQHAEQHLQQHEGDLSSNDVVQIGLLVLFTVLEGVHLVGESGTALVKITDEWRKKINIMDAFIFLL